MARPLRIQGAGLTYHVWSRGTRGMDIYLDDQDREKFLDLQAKVFGIHTVGCHAYCQMTNHYHVVITTREANLSRVIKELNGAYAQWWNLRHQHAGHVFQSRFGAQLVQDNAYLLEVCRYIVMNPVRAAMVERPQDWRWSSCRASTGLAVPPAHLDQALVGALLGGSSAADTARRFREFVEAPDASGARLPDDRILGDESFVARFREIASQASPAVPRRERELRPSLASFFAGATSRVDRIQAAVLAREAGHDTVAIAHLLKVGRSTVDRMVQSGRWLGSGRAK